MAASRGRAVSPLLAAQDGGQQRQGRGPGVHGQRRVAELDLVQEGLHVGKGVEFHGLGVEVHGVGALVELLQQDLVGLGGVMGLHLLGDLPGLFGVAGGLGAAEEVSGAGEAQALFVRRGLGLGVDGREHDALRRLGEQLLLEDAALQAFDGRRFPGLVRRGGELIEGHRSQRFGVRFGIHHNILSSMIYHYRRGCRSRSRRYCRNEGRFCPITPKRTQRGAFSPSTPGSLSAGSEPPSSGRMTFALRQVFWLMAFSSGAPSHETRSGPCAFAAIHSSGTAPDSHRIPCSLKRCSFVSIMLLYPREKVNCFMTASHAKSAMNHN